MYVTQYRKAFSTNATNTSFASKVATLTKPSNDGVVDVNRIGGVGNISRLRLLPYALGDDDDVFEMRVLGWTFAGEGVTKLWIPTPIAAFKCTVGTSVGVAGAHILDTERFSDTIVAATIPIEATVAADTTRSGTVQISSPGNNLVGFVIMPTYGYGLLEFQFDMTTGDPQSANCLYAPV